MRRLVTTSPLKTTLSLHGKFKHVDDKEQRSKFEVRYVHESDVATPLLIGTFGPTSSQFMRFKTSRSRACATPGSDASKDRGLAIFEWLDPTTWTERVLNCHFVLSAARKAKSAHFDFFVDGEIILIAFWNSNPRGHITFRLLSRRVATSTFLDQRLPVISVAARCRSVQCRTRRVAQPWPTERTGEPLSRDQWEGDSTRLPL